MTATCQCGCGQETNFAKSTDSRLGWVKRQPLRYVSGHNGRTLPPDESKIGTGLCQCGCGGKTSLARKTCRKYGWVEGKPLRFTLGHQFKYRRDRNQNTRGVGTGLCACGCGHATKIASETSERRGWIKGLPQRFIKGHNARLQVKHGRNPQSVRACAQRRRARKNLAVINDLTVKQWEAIKASYGYRCIYCGKKTIALTQDRITPISKGGDHTVSNIVPACRPCNARKYIGAPLRPIQPLLLVAS